VLINFIKNSFRNTSINRMIQLLLYVLFSIIVLLLAASLISQATMKKRFSLIIDFYWKLNREVSNLGLLTGEASYLGNFYLVRNKFEETSDFFSQKIDTAQVSVKFFLNSIMVEQNAINKIYVF